MGEFKGYCQCDGGVEKVYRYSCLMAVVESIIPTVKYVQDNILPEDIYKEDGYGIVCKPHVSVLYGFHDEKIDIEKLKELISNYKTFTININKLSCFENEEFDVLKFEVSADSLIGMNKECRDTFEHTLQFPYNPHITIAYLKKGTAKKYESVISSLSIDVFKMVYSRVDGSNIKFNL